MNREGANMDGHDENAFVSRALGGRGSVQAAVALGQTAMRARRESFKETMLHRSFVVFAFAALWLYIAFRALFFMPLVGCRCCAGAGSRVCRGD